MRIRVHRAVWETSEFDVTPVSEATDPINPDDSVESLRQYWEELHSEAMDEGFDDVSSGDPIVIPAEVKIVDDSGKILASFDAETGQDIVGQPGPLVRIDLDIAQRLIASHPAHFTLAEIVNDILDDYLADRPS